MTASIHDLVSTGLTLSDAESLIFALRSGGVDAAEAVAESLGGEIGYTGGHLTFRLNGRCEAICGTIDTPADSRIWALCVPAGGLDQALISEAIALYADDETEAEIVRSAATPSDARTAVYSHRGLVPPCEVEIDD